MAEKWHGILKQLNREKGLTKKRQLELEGELATVKASLKSLDVAIAALGQDIVSSKSTRQAPTTADVTAVAADVIAARPGIERDTLTKEIEQRLAQMGKNRVGLRLRIDQALRDERFVRNGVEYTLRAGREASECTPNTEHAQGNHP